MKFLSAIDALAAAVEDAERLAEAERHVKAGRVFDYAMYAKTFEIVEYGDDDEYPVCIGRGPTLRAAIDAARTPAPGERT
jgi:hypothetical protein